jgi:hypothetical protein
VNIAANKGGGTMKGLAFAFYFAIALLLSILLQTNLINVTGYIMGTIALIIAYILTSAFLD